jgi:hypothetical protein
MSDIKKNSKKLKIVLDAVEDVPRHHGLASIGVGRNDVLPHILCPNMNRKAIFNKLRRGLSKIRP